MSNTISRAIAIALGTAAFAVATGQGLSAAQSQTPAAQAPAAQTPATQTPATQTPTAPSSRAAGGQSMTVTGCIQREAEYRRTSGAGRGGVVGTGVGTGNEFILADATMSASGTGAATATSGANAPAPTGTAGTRAGTAYELTGSKEGDAASFVGKRVEVTGMVKPTSTAAGGPTANVPGSQDLKLSELEVSAIRETTGACAASTSPTP